MAFGVLALPGLIYGVIFSALITAEAKTSIIYRYESIGSVIGGLAVTAWAFAGLGDIYMLVILALLEFSRIFSRRAVAFGFAIIAILAGYLIQPLIESAVFPLRWPGYDKYESAHGPSGSWLKAEKAEEYYLAHNGRFIFQDRASSEDAILWPLLFKPDAVKMLLISFEGSLAYQYLPKHVKPSILISDGTFLQLADFDKSLYLLGDPLSFSSEVKFDIVNIYLPGAASIIDYRMETDYFFKRCKSFLNYDGILYVSLPSDENYLGAKLSKYQSAVYGTLNSIFRRIEIVPGLRAGFVCFQTDSIKFESNLLNSNISAAGINSPYFNKQYIMNILNPLRRANFNASLDSNATANSTQRPMSVLNYLKWQGSKFGKSARIFAILDKPFIYLAFVFLLVIPFLISRLANTNFRSLFLITGVGFIGMAFEILILYLFQIFYGTLYLHIGMIIAVFMAGISIGSISSGKLTFYQLITGNILIAIGIWLCLKAAGVEMGLPIGGFVLYMVSLMAGFFSGGLFSKTVDSQRDDILYGAVFYGTDLNGALLAAIFVPGLLIALGADGIIISIISISFAILATLSFRN